MTLSRLAASIALASLLALLAIPTTADAENVKIPLRGFEEVPAISTGATGEFSAEIGDSQITYELTYAGLTGVVTQAHIHLAQLSVNGGIMVFLCSNLGNGPAGTQGCPAPPATVTGTIAGADVLGIAAAQGLNAGEFAELVAAIRGRAAYVNVHTDVFPGGEVRGQLPGGDLFLPDNDED